MQWVVCQLWGVVRLVGGSGEVGIICRTHETDSGYLDILMLCWDGILGIQGRHYDPSYGYTNFPFPKNCTHGMHASHPTEAVPSPK